MPTSDTVEVRSRVGGESKVIGHATFPVFDSVSEAVGSEGEEKCLEYINSQVRTNEMNRIRAISRGGPSKTRLRQLAIAAMSGDEWTEVAGDHDAIEAALAVHMEAISARMAEAAAAEPVEAEA